MTANTHEFSEESDPKYSRVLGSELPLGVGDAASVVSECRLHGLFIRDVSSMGSTIGKHAIRIAVKDAVSNQRMLQILSTIINPSQS